MSVVKEKEHYDHCGAQACGGATAEVWSESQTGGWRLSVFSTTIIIEIPNGILT